MPCMHEVVSPLAWRNKHTTFPRGITCRLGTVQHVLMHPRLLQVVPYCDTFLPACVGDSFLPACCLALHRPAEAVLQAV